MKDKSESGTVVIRQSSPQMFFSLSFLQPFGTFKFTARMLIGNFDKSLIYSEVRCAIVQKWSQRVSITKPIVINVEQLFLITGLVHRAICCRSIAKQYSMRFSRKLDELLNSKHTSSTVVAIIVSSTETTCVTANHKVAYSRHSIHSINSIFRAINLIFTVAHGGKATYFLNSILSRDK